MNPKIAGKSAVFTIHDEVVTPSWDHPDFVEMERRVTEWMHSKQARQMNQSPTAYPSLWQNMTKKPIMHGVGDTLEQAVGARTDQWRFPDNVSKRSDGAVKVRVSRNFTCNSHELTVSYYVRRAHYITAKTWFARQPMLTWREPLTTPGPRVYDLLVAVVDMLALHNGVECFLAGSSHKQLNRLRYGAPKGKS